MYGCDGSIYPHVELPKEYVVAHEPLYISHTVRIFSLGRGVLRIREPMGEMEGSARTDVALPY